MQFRVLGPIEVDIGGNPRPLAGRQQRLLLATLLVRANQVVTVDELVDALWEIDPPRSARGRVHTAITQLRRALGDTHLLTWEQPGYVLRVGPGQSDADRFAQLTEEGRQALAADEPDRAATLLRAALALWRGPALGDVADRMAGPAAGLEERRRLALDARIEADLRLGRHGELVAELQELVHRYPLHERWHEHLISALHRCGRRGEALGAYDRARRVLRDELGVEPGAALRRLHHTLLDDPPEPAAPRADRPPPANEPATGPPGRPPAVSQLPPTVADFTGRDLELKELSEAVHLLGAGGESDRWAAVAVVGLAGIGKSAFAVCWANQVSGAFPDGQLFVDLRGFTERPLGAHEALDRICRALGGASDAPDLDAQRRAYHGLLAGRRILVVLDNVGDEEQVRPLLATAPGCLTVLTSRRQLSGLDAVRTLVLDVLPPDDGHRLLAAIVGGRRLLADDGARIVALCGGLPLAIRIVGARLAARPNWSLRQFAERLAREQARLTELELGRSTVRGVFTLSYRALTPTARQAFRRLGLFPGADVSRDGAACLAGMPVDHAAPLLESLVDASLLQSTQWLDRYRLHDLLRVYAGELAGAEDSAPARTAAVKRMLTWYLHTVDAAAQVLMPHRARVSVTWCRPPHPPRTFASPQEAADWCEAERGNLLALVNAAAEHGLHRLAAYLAVALGGFYNYHRHWSDWLATHRVAVDSATAIGDRGVLAMAHNGLGNVYQDLSQPAEACFHLERGLAIRRELGDEPGEASSLNNLGGTYRLMGEHDRAIECLREALAIRRRLGNQAGVGVTLNNLGDVYHTAGRHAEAIESLEEALVIHNETGHRLGRAATLVNLADVLLDVDRYDDAEDRLDQAAPLFEEMEIDYGLGLVLHHRGRLYLGRDAPEQALVVLREALDLRTRIGDPPGRGYSLEQIGIAYAGIGQPAAARLAWQQAYDILSALGEPLAQRVLTRLDGTAP